MKKPVIGITCDFDIVKPKKKGRKPRERFYMNRSYVKAITKAGGVPMLLVGTGNAKDIQQQFELLDGILLTGGMDHDPKLYGAKKHPKTKLMPSFRQQYEIQIAKLAMKTNLPILGVCLGCQTLNVVNGGTLLQDIPSSGKTKIMHRQKEGRNVLTHQVQIDKNSRLFRILKKNKVKSNSFHHQSIKNVAPGFRRVAQTPDHIVEAIEVTNKRFVLGIQWHPEELIAYKDHLAVFKALIQQAKRK